MAIFEVEGPDGRVYEVEAPDARAAAAAVKKLTAGQERTIGQALYDNIVGDPSDGVTSYGESLGTWINRAADSASLGIAGDEANAAITGMLPGRSYESELARYRGNEEAMSGLGRFSADIAGALVPGVALAGAVAKAPTLGRAVGRGILGGASAGAVQGFAEGEGGAANRFTNGILTSALGGAIGGAVPVIGAGLQAGVRGVKEALANNRISAEVAEALGISPRSGRALSEILATQDQEAMRAGLDRAGREGMLAEATPGLLGYLDEAVNSPGRASSIAIPRVNDAVNSRMASATGALDYTMGIPEGIKGAQTTIREGTKAARKSAYDAAYDTAIDWRSPLGEELRNELAGLDPSVANIARRLRGLDPRPASLIPDAAYADEFAPDVRTVGPMFDDEAARLADIDGQLAAGAAVSRETVAKRPFTAMLKKTGIDPDGAAARELYAQGVTPQTVPGLFKRGGLRDLDNLDLSQMPEGMRFSGGDGTGFYASRQDVIDAIVAENRGEAVRSAADDATARAISEFDDAARGLTAERDGILSAASQRANMPTAPDAPGDPVPMQTFRDIDRIKRAYDEIARTNDGAGLMGGQSEVGMLASQRARRIRDLLADMSPDYREALDVSSDTIRRVEAVKTGGKILTPGVTREDVAMFVDGATKGELKAVRQGVRQFIDDTLARVRAVPSDPNIDAREAVRAMSMLSSRDARDKISAILDPDNAKTVFKEIDRLSSALGVRAGIAKGSGTQPRGVAAAVVNDAVDPGLIRQGKPVEAAKEAVATGLGASKTAINRLRADARADLADVLTRAGDARGIIDAVTGISARNVVDPMAGQAARGLLQALMLGDTARMAERINRGILAPMLQPR